MDEAETKADLLHHLRDAREALLRKLDGLGEYDVRRPMTPTGTNLLGRVKHATAAPDPPRRRRRAVTPLTSG
jgi:hypothetical protein